MASVEIEKSFTIFAAKLQEGNRDVANLPKHSMAVEENAKLDYKVANSMQVYVDFDRMIMINN